MKIPVIRGSIGNWIYYTGVMNFKQIADKITTSINEMYETSCLDEVLQRALTENYQSIKNYILKDDERFFNAIIIAIYNGNPQWLEVEFDNEESEFTNLGFLKLSGEEVLFPVDGQHRVAGIKAAIKENPYMGKEQVPVIFIAHSNTPSGRKKTRKLFSTLNRRAKPVGQNENIALDEDDICSIITRELIENHPLCVKDNIINSLGKQIPTTNETAFTSLITLYQCVEIVVKLTVGKKGQALKEYKLYRPEDETIEKISEQVFDSFNSFVSKSKAISQYIECDLPNKAKEFRNSSGGNILFRPLILTEYFEAANTLIERKHADSYEDAFEKLSFVKSDLSCEPWKGLVWDGSKIIGRAPKSIIRLLLLYMADNNVLLTKEREKLTSEYAKNLNISVDVAGKILSDLSH